MIETLAPPVCARDLDALGRLLVGAVEGGASVSFLRPLAGPAACAWWNESLARAAPRSRLFVHRDGGEIAATVWLQPAWAPNQAHRAEVSKLLVHRRLRRRGLGSALMAALEAHAAQAGFTLLTLDTRRGDAAERLYRAAGWLEAGAIPGYARFADGAFVDTVIFYKRLPGAPGPGA